MSILSPICVAPGPTLETARLILRPPAIDDFDAWAAFMSDEESTRFLGGVQSRPVAWRGFATMAGSWAVLGFGMFSVIDKASGRWAGRLGPWMPDGWPGTEVGYSIIRDFQGKGYATEGAIATIDWAFATLGWTDVIHTIHPDNSASQAVARRLGSTNRGPGTLPPPFEKSPVEIWGQTREEWTARRQMDAAV